MTFLLSFIIPALLLASFHAPAAEGKYEAKIESSLQGNMLTVSNVFSNRSGQDVHFAYRFRSERTGKAGTSVSNQSGSLKAAAGQEVKLSQTAFSVTPQDTYSLRLEILDGDSLVAQDALMYAGH